MKHKNLFIHNRNPTSNLFINHNFFNTKLQDGNMKLNVSVITLRDMDLSYYH